MVWANDENNATKTLCTGAMVMKNEQIRYLIDEQSEVAANACQIESSQTLNKGFP